MLNNHVFYLENEQILWMLVLAIVYFGIGVGGVQTHVCVHHETVLLILETCESVHMN